MNRFPIVDSWATIYVPYSWNSVEGGREGREREREENSFLFLQLMIALRVIIEEETGFLALRRRRKNTSLHHFRSS